MSTGDSPFEVPGFISKQVTGRLCPLRVLSFFPVLMSQIMIHESSEAEAKLLHTKKKKKKKKKREAELRDTTRIQMMIH